MSTSEARPTIAARGFQFDADGALLDTTAIVVERRWREFAREHGLDPAEVLETVHGRRAGDVIRNLASRARSRSTK